MRNSQQKMLEGNNHVLLRLDLCTVESVWRRQICINHCQKCLHISVCRGEVYIFLQSLFKFAASSVTKARWDPHASPVAFICTHADWTVQQSNLKWAHRRISGYCAGVPLGRLWIHLDFISELFRLPRVDGPGPYPPKRDRGRENDVISSLKSYSCS